MSDEIDARRPDDRADAYAALGILEGAGATEPAALAELIQRATGEFFVSGAPLLKWQTRTPPEDLRSMYDPGGLAAAWREAMGHINGFDVRPANVRLWLHVDDPATAATLLARATPPPGGVVVLSRAKLSRREPAVPRWTWPLVVGIDSRAPFTGELLIDPPAWLGNLVRFVDLRDPLMRCSLAVLRPSWPQGLVDPYGRARAAAALVLGGAPLQADSPMLLDRDGLGSVAAVAFTGNRHPRQLVEIVRHLSHDLAFDEAVTLAALSRGQRRPVVYAERAHLDRTRLRRMTRDRALERNPVRVQRPKGAADHPGRNLVQKFVRSDFQSEGGDSTHLARDLRAFESTTGRLEQRYLRCDAERRGATSGSSSVARLTLGVWIGPWKKPDLKAIPVDESSLDWEGDTIDLCVALIPLNGRAKPQRRTLVLPRVGESDPVQFQIRASWETPYVGRLAVLRKNRFVQTAKVTVTPDAKVLLQPETVVRPISSDLLDLVPAGAALVHNHDESGHSQLAAITDDNIFVPLARDLSKTTATFQRLLEDVAQHPERYGDPNGDGFKDLVVELAKRGKALNELLFAGRVSAAVPETEAEALEKANAVSVLSAVAGEVLPIEFVYDRELRVGMAKRPELCPHAVRAAAKGACCNSDQNMQTVCPFGFWGMRMVVERHINRKQTQSLIRAGWSHALASMPTIADSVATVRAVMGAASAIANDNPEQAWDAAMDLLKKHLPGDVQFPSSWSDWAYTQREQPADILLMLPHVGRAAARPYLEIGDDKRFELDNTDLKELVKGLYPDQSDEAAMEKYRLRTRAPIVLLLGCATAAGEPLNEFPVKFLDAGARLVIGTLTSVRGHLVAPLGAQLALDIIEDSRAQGIQVGVLMRRLRQKAFVTGDPTAMALVAFGDSSWIVKSR
jgi:hypothetical protein